MSIKTAPSYAPLLAVASSIQTDPSLHLKNLLADPTRYSKMSRTITSTSNDDDRSSCRTSSSSITFDYSRQNIPNDDTFDTLIKFASERGLSDKIQAMRNGEYINSTENRPVLHHALRFPKNYTLSSSKITTDAGIEVHKILDRIKSFTDDVRNGKHTGCTGKLIKNVISIGIGGSHLGPEFVHESLRYDPASRANAENRTLRFLANVDPVDFAGSIEGLNVEETIVVVVSKTFGTAETMLNARTARKWLVDGINSKLKAEKKEEMSLADICKSHVIAVSTAIPLAVAFGIAPENIFGFWDWVGGRYSVSSAVGVLPLSLQYGFDVVEQFLSGMHNIDEHFFNTTVFDDNVPVIMGLLGIWNNSFLQHTTRVLLPYSQALKRLPAHIQQLDMESNGKRVLLTGAIADHECGEINFGEPGTNGQHSFYQLIHQGRVVPCDFIGFVESQAPVGIEEGDKVCNHDELMSNFFAQPDALAYGKSAEVLKYEGCVDELIAHKTFSGNRPSTSLLATRLDAYTLGQLLALYEHRTTTQGFLWNINSFDQWGVELGKALAGDVRGAIEGKRKRGEGVEEGRFNNGTKAMLDLFLRGDGGV